MLTFYDFDDGAGATCPAAVSAATDDLYYNNVAFQIDATSQADGTGYSAEESRNAATLNYQGTAAISGERFIHNGGIDDVMYVAGSPLYTPSRLTIEVWSVNLTSLTGAHTFLAWWETLSADRSFSFRWTANQLQLLVSTNGTTETTIAAAWTPTLVQNYDIACSWDGYRVRLYVDGAYIGGGDLSGARLSNPNNTANLRVGAERIGASNSNYLRGSFKAMRYTKGVARMTNESGCYTRDILPLTTTQAATTDPNWDDTVLLVRPSADGTRIWDDSPYDWPLTFAGDVAVDGTNTLADGTRSLAFDGSGDYITIPDHPLLELGSNDFTLEVFARHNTAGLGAAQRYISKYTATLSTYGFGYRGDLSGDPMIMSRSSGSAALSPWAPSGETWYHATYCRASGTGRHFSNGSLIGSISDAITYSNTAIVTSIGRWQGSTPDYMNGNLAEIRVTMAARYTAAFTAPTGALDRF